ncbi:MAG: TrmH family RNA methyltransferase [Candidatus Liptonbacteria bacterium]|nr:TrmH family RNA methyltransferase [Candidatus Liptonbacteria bacterium]
MSAKNKKPDFADRFVAALHNVRSLHNVGSIFRTADGAGIKKIYLCGITPAPVDNFGRQRPQFAKVSLGAEKSVEWEKASSTARLIKRLKKDGYKILAVERAKNSVLFYKTSKSVICGSKLCLVVGNEVKGLPLSVLKLSDEILEIPMMGNKESLNVSVAFGIVAYHLSSIMTVKKKK